MEIITPSTPSSNNALPSLINPTKSIINTTPNTISAPLSGIKSNVSSSDYENETTILLENNSNDNSDSVANSPTSSHSECNTPSIDAIEIEKSIYENNTQTKIDLIELPTLQLNKLSRQFIDEANIEVTSVDITSHGCYILVGCGNGFILLYDLSNPMQQGILVGHIRAKGLHTNLLLSVKITEDCRYCFAGVIRGSSEMVAIDLGRLPVWNNANMNITPRRKSIPILDLITTHSYSDAKLRGFGAAVRVQYPDEINRKDTYRLVCGRGIKNVHVWQFVPAPLIRSGMENIEPTWNCIYDVASNGNTIELMEFRKGGMELMSKSAGVNLRVWDLSQYDVDPTAKPLFEDIPNSQDMRSMLDGFAFGGTYDFAVVRLDAPKAANRSAFVVPERNIEDDNGQRRKRLMRQIDEVIGTNDGSHVLALCTDGGVLYFKNISGDKEGDEFIQDASLIEFNSLRRTEEVDMIWNTKRVGRNGDVVLVRATRIGTIDAPITSIEVKLLTDAASPGEVMTTSITFDNHNNFQSKWNPCGYYYDYDPTNTILDPIQDDIEEFKALPKTGGNGKPPLAPTVKKVKKNIPLLNKENSAVRNNSSSTPTRTNSNIKSSTKPQHNQTPNENSKSQFRTPSHDSISPRSSDNNSTTIPTQKRPRVISPRSNNPIVSLEETSNEFEDDINDLPPVKRNSLMIGNYSKNEEIIVSNEIIPLPIVPNIISNFYQQFTTLKNNWLRNSQQLSFLNSNNLNSFDDLLSANNYSFGVVALQQLGIACAEQNRLRQQFITDITTKSNNYLSLVDLADNKEIISFSLTTGIQNIITMYQSLMVSLILRQQMDLRGACAMDNIYSGKNSVSALPSIRFKYGNIFSIAERYDANINNLLVYTNKLLIESNISNNDDEE